MVRSDLEASEGPFARAEHQLWLCRRVRNFPHSSSTAFPSPKFPQTHFWSNAATSALSNRLILSGFLSLSLFFYATRALGLDSWFFLPGSFRTFVATGVTRPSFSPHHSAWGMRGVPERKRRNSHVWMNKRAESEGITADMEENTLSGATCKSRLGKAYVCFVIHVLCHIATPI